MPKRSPPSPNDAVRRWRSGNLGRLVTVTSGDLDGDGESEVLAAAGKELKIYDWRLGTYVLVHSDVLPQEILSLTVGDLDGDGCLEVIVGTRERLVVFHCHPEPGGGGQAQPKTQAPPQPPPAVGLVYESLLYPNAYFRQLTAGDLDGDGRDELVAAASGAQTIYIFKVLGGAAGLEEIGRIYLGGLAWAEVGDKEIVAGTREGFVDVFIPTVMLPPHGGRSHVVRQGEQLWRIARRYRTTVEALLRANGLQSPAEIAPGKVLVIPQKE